MKIQALSIIAGNDVCNARCPFCVARMTGNDIKITPINRINFHKACRIAQISDVTNVMITGKGETTLFPDQITEFLELMSPYNFPVIEIQTNAITIANNFEKYQHHLETWHKLGLTIISISIFHYDPEKNRLTYVPYLKSYPDLFPLIEKLKQIGFTVRLNVTLVKGGIDSVEEVSAMITKAKEWQADQLTLRKLAVPENSKDLVVYNWSKSHQIEQSVYDQMEKYLLQKGNKVAEYSFGGSVYDIDGQNVCFTNCLTTDKDTDNFRQGIYYPDGHLRFDWKYNGAIIF